jgi:hypothetical protein
MPRDVIAVPVSHIFRIGLALLVSALVILCGCSKSQEPVAEAPVLPQNVGTSPAPLTAQANQPQQISKLPSPQMTEVQQAVKRVFKEAVLIDTSHQPTFIVGDFNGDHSQDIAVVLKPASDKLSELNEEAPTWILRDLAGPTQPGSPRLRVGAKDKLLAIIHGYDGQGWRDHQATQTYLLKNAAGSGMAAHSAKDFLATHQGSKLPKLQGDLVGEELGGKSGYLYYAGATYSWYDPKTFTGETERRVVHMADSGTKK